MSTTHIVSANGTTADPNTGDVQVPIYKREITLTDAQIKALPSTPFEIMPSPGVNKVYAPLVAVLNINSVAGAYTNVGAAGTGLTAFYCHNLAIPVFDQLNTGLGGSVYPITLYPKTQVYGAGDTEVIKNIVNIGESKPLYGLSDFKGDPFILQVDNYDADYAVDLGNFTGGNAANTIEVTVLYTIVDL